MPVKLNLISDCCEASLIDNTLYACSYGPIVVNMTKCCAYDIFCLIIRHWLYIIYSFSLQFYFIFLQYFCTPIVFLTTLIQWKGVKYHVLIFFITFFVCFFRETSVPKTLWDRPFDRFHEHSHWHCYSSAANIDHYNRSSVTMEQEIYLNNFCLA